jgi:oligosaccharyltransferase complex subunit beta
LSPKNIIEFMNKDGNVLLALSGKSTTPSAISSLLLELDLHLSTDRSSVVVDHFNYDALSAVEKHDILLLQRPGQLRDDTKPFFGGEGVLAFPRAVPHTLGDSNPLLAPILRAPATAYSYSPKEDAGSVEDVLATGSQLALVSAMQSRNSARFTLLGSAESLQDQWFTATVKSPGDGEETETANREFAKQLTAWTFKETGVLKVGDIEHHLADNGDTTSELNPKIYRIKNETVCSNDNKPVRNS